MEWIEEEIVEDGSIDGNMDDDDDDDASKSCDVKKDLHKYPVHDPNKKWDAMVPVLEMPKKIAMDEIEGSLVAHYEKLGSYGLELLRTNPVSTVKLDMDIMLDSTIHFSKMYICLKVVKDGWIEGCKRVIGVDGCFLKGLCRGEIMAVDRYTMCPCYFCNLVLKWKYRGVCSNLGHGQCHGVVEDVGGDLEEEVGGDSEEEVGGDEHMVDLEVDDEQVVNPGNQHVLAPNLKKEKVWSFS
uniref:Uncharacterized protein n=1 Tax=Lactuca sativa TaxID=4236 RepID=A0A9R1VLK4_LACSA|nr:hypothetical protein LSAT_V11C500297880 [Lactuca sativa]